MPQRSMWVSEEDVTKEKTHNEKLQIVCRVSPQKVLFYFTQRRWTDVVESAELKAVEN
jgi:hypothetical protein